MQVRDLMTTDVVALKADIPIADAEEIMGWRRFRHLPVIDADGKLVGLVTHRDVLRSSLAPKTKEQWLEAEIRRARVTIREIMQTRIELARADTPLVDAARKLRTGKYGCLPVVDDDGKLVGIVTEADFVKLVEVLLTRAGDGMEPEIRAALAAM